MNWLRGAWQFLRAPRFAVDIDMKSWNYTNEFVTAGEKTKICTISVSLDYDGQLDRSKYVRPLSNYYQHDKVYVTCENERWVNETLVLDMFVYVTVAGAYSIIPKFPADSYVKFKGTDRGVGLEVKPSNTCYILLKKYVNSNPIADECSEKFVSSYRGDTVNMYVAVVDEFQNKYLEDDLDFRIVSDNQSVKVVQLTTHDRRTGWYVISVRYHKVGTTTIKLSFQEETHLNAYTLNQVVKVLTPPVSAAKSYIIQSDIDEIQDRTHEAGKAITFKLQLIDIIGNPISYEESKVFLEKFIGLVSHRDTVARNEGIARRRNANQENIAPKVRPVDFDPNICEVEFTPSIAGNRRVSLFANRKTDEISMITIRIKPGPLAELQILNRVPSDFREVYRGDRAKIWVKAKDEFGNRIVESNLTFAIFSDSSLVKLLSTDCVDDSEQGSHQLTIRWEKVGKGSFDLIVSQGKRQVRKDIPLEVIPPPVSAAKSYIIQSDIDEIQEKIHEAGQAITFKLKLIDIFGNAICYEESKSFVESICLALHKTSQVSGSSSKKLVQSSREENSSRMCPNSDVHSNNACEDSPVVFTAKGKNTVTGKRHNADLENTTGLQVRPLDVDPNICEVEFTPSIAGNTRVSLFADRKTEEISTITIIVKAGPLAELQIVKRAPTDFSNVHRGDTAKIWVKAKDEFGNRIVESNLTFAIFSDSSLVKLLSTNCVDDSEQGSHQLTIRWEKVGKGSFDLIASQGNRQVRKDIPLKVIPPPVSAAKSYIIQSDIDKIQDRTHEAGKAITFKLQLIDIFGNAISYEESKVFLEKSIGLVSHRDTVARNEGIARRRNANQENIAPKVRPVDFDPNICEVEFTPSIAGNRRVSLFANRKTDEISTITIIVKAGPLAELQIVKRAPTDFSNVHRGDTAKIWVKAKDEFGNRIVESNLTFAIFSDSSLVKLLSTDCVDDSEQGSHQLTIRWEKVGKGSFDLIVSQGKRQVRKDIPLEVIPPPVSAAKSYIIQSDIDEIQEKIHEAGQAITFKLKLIDIFGNAICYEESKSFVESICLALHKTSQVSGSSSKKLVQSSREENSSRMCPNSDVHSNNACEDSPVVFTAKGKNTVTGKRHNADLENTTGLQVRPLDVDPNICEVEFTPSIAGNRRVSLFADRKTEEISTITIIVKAGPLAELQIVKRAPTDFSNVHRGDTAKIWVKAKDEFGNRIVESNLTFAIFSDSSLVKLLSTNCVDDSEQGSHQLTIRWEKVGKGSFDLIASQGNRQVRKDIPLKVIPPPVSAAKSYIIQSDIDKIQDRTHEAGKAITFKLQLIDIFGNAISYEESKVFLEKSIGLVSHRDTVARNEGIARRRNANQENIAPKVRPVDVDPNICEVEFTPSIAGNRRVSLFANRKTDEISTITIIVKAGPLAELQIVKRAPTDFSNVHRGDTAKIWVKAKDEFGNRIVESNLTFAIFSDSSLVKLLSTNCVDDSEQGSHQLTIRWEKVGKVSFDLIVSQGKRQVRKDIPLKVIPPPVSAAKSYIIQSDIDEIQERIHEAGKGITFKLKLIDIFGNAICYEESKSFVESICLAFHKTSQVSEGFSNVQSAGKENSFKTNPCDVDSKTCELTITPYIVGKRVLSLSLNEEDKEVKKSPLSFAVKPGPLAEIQIVSHEPPASNQNIFSYSKQQRTVVVKGKDEFGNEVPMDPTEWYLDALGDLKQEAKLNTGENLLAFQYSFDKPGTYKVDIRPKKSLTKLAKVPYFEVEIIKVPLDVNKCLSVCADEKPIFVGEPQSSFSIRVSLFDCIGNRYSPTADSEFRTELLSIKVNDQAANIIAHESGTEEGEIYVTTVLDNKNINTKDVQVIYNDEPLGEKLSVKIVGLQPYRTENFVRLYRIKKVICCKDVCRGMLADYANLDNINRIVHDPAGEVILLSSDINENTDNMQVQLINVDLKKFDSKTLSNFLEIISLFVEGAHHYRTQANEFDREREKWKFKSIEAYFSGKHEEARACSAIKEKFATLMNQCHSQASDKIFEFYNRGRPQSEVDLHGQLVADSVKIKEYREQLLSKRDKSAAEVDSIIESERQERDEAIRILDKRLRNFDHEKAKRDGEDWLEIIDGAGHHSARRGEQKIRPKVKEYLRKKNIQYVEANEGALLITFSEYTGKEPCVADFYCTRCKKTWPSASSWKGFFQKCFRCYRKKGIDSKCYPFKLRPLGRQKRQRSGAESTDSNFRFTREDHRKLCQKCIELRRDCKGQ